MKRVIVSPVPRRGAVAPTVAVLSTLILAMVAFGVDMGYLLLVHQQLQNSADAAALAGAGTLPTYYASYSAYGATSSQKTTALSNAVTAAKNAVKSYAGRNPAGNVTLSVLDGGNGANGQAIYDIVVGYTATPGTAGTITPTDTTNASSNWPNAVQVTVRRDTNANGEVSLFFSPVIGISTMPSSATAVAATLAADQGLNPKTGYNGLLLPIVVDYNSYNSFLTSGKNPDGTTAPDSYQVDYNGGLQPNPNGGFSIYNVNPAPDGIKEFKGYGQSMVAPGNFGLLNIGDQSSKGGGSPKIANWINNGPSSQDMQDFLSAQPGSPTTFNPTAASPYSAYGEPGLKSSLVSDFQNIVGETRLLPLYSTVSGNGSNTIYNIVAVVPVTIVSATGHGANLDIQVQPASGYDPTGTGSGAPASPTTTGIGNGTFTLPKLYQ